MSGFITYGKIVLFIAAIMIVGACAKDKTAEAVSSPQPAKISQNAPSATLVKGLDARKALALANKWGTGEPGVTSFVDTQKIAFEFANGDRVSVPLPKEKMVVAIAPYRTTTHPCATHYMSGCQGELVNIPVKVFGKTADGMVVVDDTYITQKNGFIELWLGRNLSIDLTIELDGKRASQRITTKTDSNTCITTMQLL